MDAICIRDLKRDLKKNMDESRYEHTLGVMYTAGALAMRYECDLDKALLAGLMHDLSLIHIYHAGTEVCKAGTTLSGVGGYAGAESDRRCGIGWISKCG